MIRVQIKDVENLKTTEYVALKVALAHNGTEAGLLITRVDKSLFQVDITGLQVVFTPQAEGENHGNYRGRGRSWFGKDNTHKAVLPAPDDSGYDEDTDDGADELADGDE